jgi:hypothetical protein
MKDSEKILWVSIFSLMILRLLYPLTPTPFTVISYAFAILYLITSTFVNIKYQYKNLYYSLIAVILVLVLIITYSQISVGSYQGNSTFDHFIIGFFVFVTILTAYGIKLKMDKYQESIVINNNVQNTDQKAHRYLECERCGGYYELQNDESPKDFKECQCGGKLEYTEKLF